MSIPAFFATLWGAVASPSGQAVIGMLNLGGTTYTAVKATQNSNKLSSLQSTCYGIATELKEVKSNTSDLFTISDMEDLISGSAPSPTPTPTTTAPTATTTTTPTQTPTAPAAPAVTAQDNVPAWAQQLMQQQLQQAEVIKGLMQNAAPNVPANTTVNVNPTPTVPAAPTAPPATAPASVPTIPDAAPAPAPVDPALMAFLQQQANAINELASAVTALKTSIGEIEAVIDDADSIPTTTAPVVTVTPPTTTTTTTTPPTGGRG